MSNTPPAAVLEAAEAEFMYQYEVGTPADASATLHVATARIGGGVVLSMRGDRSGYWSKALGFGFEEPVTDELIGRVLDFYRGEGAGRAVLQIAPSVLPPDWEDIRARHGLRPGGEIVKVCGPVDAFVPGSTQLRVGPVGPQDAEEWATVVLSVFGMLDQGLMRMMTATVGHPRFRPFAVWDGDRVVAGANLYLHGDVGALNAGATLPEYRGRGAQSALMAARAEQAAAAGCRWLIAEAGRPGEGESNPSLNNMLRAGLRPVYHRRNWIWQQDAPEEA
ncbi:GNAT family N-acetyltransferase [Sphaerisporangium sp. NPDC005289]|uniref:GNAT family N-acetyltransferase n=1 Tax=Sphaerisporangium sp. NPDC005289 TaxID=3155247 RepID=UPI00339EE274